MNENVLKKLDEKIKTFKANSTQATNSQRRKIKEIFSFILNENLKHVNEFGYSEIPCGEFRKIDHRNYSILIHWLEENNFIKIRRNNKNGTESYSGKNYMYVKSNNGYVITSVLINSEFCKGFKALI